MLDKKYAFTMAETMLTIAVIGVLAAIMIPAMKKFTPDKSKSLFKKAANVTERIVYEMYNDDEIYPRIGKDGVKKYDGFNNTERVVYMGNEYGADSNGYKKAQKFCQIFARKLSTNNDSIDCSPKSGLTARSVNVSPTITTVDGIAWYIPITDFNDENYHAIYVDVNGKDKGPNCYVANGNACGKDPDIFKINIDKYGNVDFYGREKKGSSSSNNYDSDGGTSFTSDNQSSLLKQTNLFKK